MNFKSAYVVLAFAGILRIFNFSIPTIVIALISVMAVCLSLSDFLEITKYKKYSIRAQFLALICFVALMPMWLFQMKINHPTIPLIGDSFTMIGLGLVIGSFGLKEILEHRSKENGKKHNEIIAKYKFEVTSNEYKEMEKLSNVIEKLKVIDQEAVSFNKLHNGWTTLFGILNEEYENRQRPFFDGANRIKYREFLVELHTAIGKIGSAVDVGNPNATITRKIDMWGDEMPVTLHPKMKSVYSPDWDEIDEAMKNMLLKWKELKEMMYDRYEKERANQK
ncbi:APC family permease [Bacillus sp. NPDC094106]|uniref:APC family permease n=1 Tax=Bacillus sp. NPDC094106 TaxID=3363949 RepID=UPI00381EBAB5